MLKRVDIDLIFDKSHARGNWTHCFALHLNFINIYTLHRYLMRVCKEIVSPGVEYNNLKRFNHRPNGWLLCSRFK